MFLLNTLNSNITDENLLYIVSCALTAIAFAARTISEIDFSHTDEVAPLLVLSDPVIITNNMSLLDINHVGNVISDLLTRIDAFCVNEYVARHELQDLQILLNSLYEINENMYELHTSLSNLMETFPENIDPMCIEILTSTINTVDLSCTNLALQLAWFQS